MKHKPKFEGALILEDVDGHEWIVHDPIKYFCSDGDTVTIPFGFRTDLASIPRLFWRLFKPTGRYDKAAVIHDKLYRTHWTDTKEITREYADWTFLEAMQVCGCWWITRNAMWTAVRVGGVFTWSDMDKK